MAYDFLLIGSPTESVMTLRAVSEVAEAFAEDHFEVESWQGRPTHFTTDTRIMINLVERLLGEGWTFCEA
jgi:hypothetical protein